jgi:hypothetical protein
MYDTRNQQGEKRMRAKSLLAAAAAIALGACSADAAFTVTSNVTPGTGVNAGKSLVRFFAQGITGSTQVLGVDARLNIVNLDGTPGPGTLLFRNTHLDEDDLSDWDVLNYSTSKEFKYSDGTTRNLVTASIAPGSPQITTFIRPQGGNPDSYTVNLATSIDPPNPESNPTSTMVDTDGDFVPDAIDKATIVSGATPNPAYGGTVKSLRVAGAYTTGIGASNPPGALIAQAVVDSNTLAVQIQFNYPGDPNNGGIGDQTGTRFKPADVIQPVPEPGSMFVLGIGAMGLLARRRRA